MSGIRIALNELRRLSSGTLPKLALLALVLVPLLYASLYLYANQDPYGRLDKLPAAVVTNDTGAADENGDHRVVGREVADELVRSSSFQWHEVSAEDARQGVRDDDYAFAITIPEDFSAALLSTGDFQPRQATITLTTNDANNYLAGTIADQVAEQVKSTIAEKVGSEAAERFLVGFSTIYSKISEATEGASELAEGARELKSGQQELAGGTKELASKTTELASGLNTLRQSTADLPQQSQQLADGAGQVAQGNARIAEVGSALASGSADLQGDLDQARADIERQLREAGLPDADIQRALAVLDELRQPVDQADAKIQDASGKLSTLADGANQVAQGAAALAGSAPALTEGIGTAADGAQQLAEGAGRLDEGQREALSGTTRLSEGATELREGLGAGLEQIPNPDDPTRTATANTIADPVAINSVGMSSAGTYGAGLAPFFIGLATWIGAFVLYLLLRPLSTRALTAGASPLRVAIGGWLPSAVLGVAQVVVLFGAVTWLVGIHVEHPAAAVGFVVLTSLTFTAIVHALNALFGAVGKFLGLVLLVLQLVSAGGTFPWQTIPDPLYPLHVVLPMGYVIDGLRHLLYSGASLQILGDIGVLVAYLVGGLAISTLAAYKRRVWTVTQLKPELSL
ncbi:YhgE/Pip domain-containing protein [Amycolatopsis cihanbeyliensis]|uniref:Putative membrane protein n=1 Tax=Amycolatopsis cihanbeyliensis TaxID=1128664 RepID=A0A542DEU3_AMYCI|nr:YhgE/Pip domain-containing protein [Amycolatopsis cihanbeyliensis]TQJ01560.1 putative membrane protein [Amycolatopsis cihanbeyliensis]